MPVSSDFQKLRSDYIIRGYDFDPDSADATNVAWVDMREATIIMAQFIRTVGTGDVDTFSIVASPVSDGSSGVVTVKTHAIASQPDAVGDQLFLEVTDSEIATSGSELRYVSAQVEFATATDEGVVNYIRKARYPGLDRTADIIA